MKNKGVDELRFWLWWHRLQSQKKEAGNTLLVAIALGLLLMVGTSISLLNSSRAKTNAKSSESSQQAMAVAELGVARVHDFLVRNPVLATHNSTEWDNLAGTTQIVGTFTNTSSGTSSCQNIVNASGFSPLTTTIERFKTSGDLVEENNPRKGGIKVVDYRYEEIMPQANASNGQIYAYGHLTVKGQINPIANNVSEVFDRDNSSVSKAQVKVKIPLRKNTTPFTFPGVWISNQAIQSPTNSIIQANLLVPSCNNMGLQIASGYQVILSPIANEFPSLPTPPADNNPRYYNLGDVTNSITLPRATDEPIETETVVHNGNTYQVKVYKYKVNSINLNGGEKITIIPGRKVVLHVYGNISLGGSQVIDNRCTSVSGSYTCDNNTKIVTYQGGEQSVFRRENLVILGYARNTGPATSTEPSICLAGGAEIFGFVFAPDYAVGAAGTGNGNGFTGAVWARLFNPPSVCGSNTGQVVVVQDITDWGFLEGVGIRMGNLPPKVDKIIEWERKEAN